MKKVYESTDLIKKMEIQKLKDNEDKRIEKYGVSNFQIQKNKEIFEEKKNNEKKKFIHVRDNYEEIQKENEVKNQEITDKITRKKLSKINEIFCRRTDEYINKRQSSYDRFIENYSNIKKLSNRKNLKLLRMQQIKNRRSVEKARSLYVSRDNMR